MLRLVIVLLAHVRGFVLSRHRLALENVALRQQLTDHIFHQLGHELEQELGLASGLAKVLQQSGLDVLFRPYSDPVGDVHQECHQVIGDFSLALPTPSGEPGVPHRGWMTAQFTYRLTPGTLSIMCDQLSAEGSEPSAGQTESTKVLEFPFVSISMRQIARP